MRDGAAEAVPGAGDHHATCRGTLFPSHSSRGELPRLTQRKRRHRGGSEAPSTSAQGRSDPKPAAGLPSPAARNDVSYYARLQRGRSRFSWLIARLPSSISWISATRRRVSVAVWPCRSAISAMMAICASISVLRLRTARSRQMPYADSPSRGYAPPSPPSSARCAPCRHPPEGAGIEAVEALRLECPRERDRHDLAAERAVEGKIPRRGERVGDRFVGQRRREEQRA